MTRLSVSDGGKMIDLLDPDGNNVEAVCNKEWA
jgi:hypothetical protein